MYEKNIEILDQVTKEKAAIRHISRHRNPDGTLDVKGNLKIWKDVTSRFERVPLWEKGAPGFDPEDSRQEQPFLIFVPSGQKNSDTILIAHGGGFLWRTGCEGIDTAKYFHDRGFHTAILSYRLLPYSRMDSFADMRRAIRLLRSKTEAWELGEHLYVMGFSAGGMLAANCATQFDYGNCLISVEKAKDTLECGKQILDGKINAEIQKVHFFHGPFYRYKDIYLYNGSFEELHSK